MIKLACNYLTEAEELLNENKIDIDYFKYPSLSNDIGFKNIEVFYDTIRKIKEVKPVLYHGSFPSNIFICDKNFKDKFDIEAFKQVCELSETHGISLHFNGADAEDSREEVIKNAVENIQYLKQHFPNMSFMTIENSPSADNKHVLDPCVISEVVDKAEIGFLYDISHAYKSSKKQGVLFEDYFSKLPLHKVHEIHVNGWEERDGDLQAHMCIQEELYDHIEFVIKNYPVKIVTLEYGRSNDRINSGCPTVCIDKINLEAKKEVQEQITKLREIIYR